MTRPYTILVVDDDPAALSGIAELLRDAGYDVTESGTFEHARQVLKFHEPDLLIADLRLRAFNGLQLVVRGRLDHPEMAAMIVTGFADPALEVEAQRYGAAYVVKPLDPPHFLALVARTLESVKRRRWPRRYLATGVAAHIADAEATIIDISYGGFRFELPHGELPRSLRVSLPAFGLSVTAEPVWTTRAGPEGSLWCGAALSEMDAELAGAWRGLVDSLAVSR